MPLRDESGDASGRIGMPHRQRHRSFRRNFEHKSIPEPHLQRQTQVRQIMQEEIQNFRLPDTVVQQLVDGVR